MNMGCNLGGLVSPAITPLLASRIGWDHALHVAAVLSVAGGLLWLGIGIPAAPAAVDHSALGDVIFALRLLHCVVNVVRHPPSPAGDLGGACSRRSGTSPARCWR